MSNSSADEEILQDYLVECHDHLATIEADLLAIEKAGVDIDEQLMNRVFRAAHSIKGGAGFFDLNKIQELAHKIENVLDLIRSRRLVPSSSVINVLLSSFDRLNSLLQNHRESNEASISTFVATLIETASGELPPAQKNLLNEQVTVALPGSTGRLETSAFDLDQVRRGGKHAYVLTLDLIENIQNRGWTPSQLLKSLMELGDVLDTKIDLESAGTLEDNGCNRLRVEILYASAADTEDIARNLEVSADHLRPVDTNAIRTSSKESTTAADRGNNMTNLDRQKVIEEFRVESNENLSRLDREMVELETKPKDSNLLSSVFRTIHTIKGTCGLLGFNTLQSITHLAENLLSQVRDGKRDLTPALVTLILSTVDAIRRILETIETTGKEGPDEYEELRRQLAAADALVPTTPSVASGSEQPSDAEASMAPNEQAKGTEPIAASATEPDNAATKAGNTISDSTIRVAVEHLDKLMNLVGELVLTRNQILQFNAQNNDVTLNAASQRLNLITTELQGGVMKTRLQPIGLVWNKLPRLVRDLSSSLGKQIHLEMEGAGTELDKTIIEAIKDPITHIVRNACDHGFERPEVRVRNGKSATGTLTLRAFHEGGQVNIEIADDGAGMDVQQLKNKAVQKGLIRAEQAERMSDREGLSLIFLAGFSMAKEVTNVSGRGVGMDVVKTNIEKIGGVVDLTSRPGEGTTIKLKIPLTLAIIPGLVVSCGNERFVIPQVSLLELIRLEGDTGKNQIEWIHGTPVYRRRDKLLPIAYLNKLLRQESKELDVLNIVVLQAEDRQFGLVVDGINDTQEIVVKPLGKTLKSLNCYAGATIMGDGRVALILDVLGIGQLSRIIQDYREQTRCETERKEQSESDRQTFLLFRAGPFERLSVPLSLVARLEEIPQSSIEHAGGKMVVQYRGQILPLASLGPILESGSTDTASAQDPAQVVVFTNGERSLGIVVDQIVDIVEGKLSIRQQATRRGLLGSAVIGKKITDVLDLHAVMEAAGANWWRDRTPPRGDSATVMVAERSPFCRGMLRSCLEMAGYRVVEAGNSDEALRLLEHRRIDIVAASMDLPADSLSILLKTIHETPDLHGIPVLGLAGSAEEAESSKDHRLEFEDCHMKFDREAMLRSISKLAAATAHPEVGDAALSGRKN